MTAGTIYKENLKRTCTRESKHRINTPEHNYEWTKQTIVRDKKHARARTRAHTYTTPRTYTRRSHTTHIYTINTHSQIHTQCMHTRGAHIHTHRHGDHYDPQAVASHWKTRTKTAASRLGARPPRLKRIFISYAQAVARQNTIVCI